MELVNASVAFYLFFSCTDLMDVLGPNQHQVRVDSSGLDLSPISRSSFS